MGVPLLLPAERAVFEQQLIGRPWQVWAGATLLQQRCDLAARQRLDGLMLLPRPRSDCLHSSAEKRSGHGSVRRTVRRGWSNGGDQHEWDPV